ncbi:carboxypeptidase regulatory-like domain-containing protein [Sphingobium sp. BYY-5]|uniref:carboxypeptidase regulatory-like domain-containing protein n=1 Tax=Sphingobium sp. BYY-5 TaxID=2926400 RepID=UPI001FA6AD2A|nr:carboxypeptidase regulatory-like domain-containing protein [Sphingobium sp. BYY-5]MCI4592689.1 carboxypeptidase regulatory-like domain-containing protein [Sphingobium sp. BYY-5]
MYSRYSLLTCGASVVALAIVTPAQAQERIFDIPAQPAVRAIPELARQAQVQIVAPARDLEGISTPAIKGRMDIRTALRRLIAGTPLRIDADDGNIITLRSSRPAAQGPAIGIGTVRGRVFNTATGEYLRNAEIRVEGTSILVFSDDDGEFRLTGVPAGTATVIVKYTGLASERLTAAVASGQVATLDVALQARTSSGSAVDAASAITVTARREGQAAAIMERRAATNAKTVVAADNYGLLTMGDVGEFMKQMPGISLDYTEVDATAVRIGGLDPKIFDLHYRRRAHGDGYLEQQ